MMLLVTEDSRVLEKNYLTSENIPYHIQKRDYSYCLSLKFIIFIFFKNKNIYLQIIIDINY